MTIATAKRTDTQIRFTSTRLLLDLGPIAALQADASRLIPRRDPYFGSHRLAVETDARMLVRERMRSALAILAGAAAVGLYMGQARSGFLSPQASTPALLQAAISFGVPALIAFIVGFVVRRRGWLAAAAAFLVGLALWVVVELRPSPPWVPTDIGGTWEAVGLRAIIFGAWSALCGAAGSSTARAREGASIRIS